MNRLRVPSAMSLALVLALTGRSLPAQPPSALPPSAAARLDSLRHSPELAGTAIYRGIVLSPRDASADTLFTYERRVQQDSTWLRVSHVTRDRAQQVIIEESAVCSTEYALRRFDAINAQSGSIGSVVVHDDGRRVDFRLESGGRVRTASHAVREPVVSGPTVHGFVRAHWDTLHAGARLRVRMIVLSRMTTYGFEVRASPSRDGLTTFTLTPTNAIIRLAVAPLRVTFDSLRNVVRYEGRVPPRRLHNGTLHDLEADVHYTMLASSYR